MKNSVYFLVLLVACTAPEVPSQELLKIDMQSENQQLLEDTVLIEDPTEKLPELPAYPFEFEGPDACLPLPTREFLDKRRAGTLHGFTDSEGLFLDEIYLYLEMALDTVSSKQFYHSPYSSISLVWGQEFENGIYFVYQELESGGSVELWSHCRDKDAFFRAIDLLVNEEEEVGEEPYEWNKLQTEYGPVEGGAGCYYSLDMDSLGYWHLSTYCGC